MVLIIFGLPDTNIPVWKIIPSCSVMINALRYRENVLPNSVKLWMDSGGFQVLTKGLEVDVDKLIKIYSKVNAYAYMSLDVPPRRMGENSKALLRVNIENFEKLYTRLEGKNIVPVVHASLHPDAIMEFIDTVRSYGCKYLACGGAVPMILSKWGRKAKDYAIMSMALIRKVFPGWLHALGVGGSNVMKVLMEILKFDSFDSSAWRIKAAYGKVMVPGVGERYVGKGKVKFGKTRLSETEREILIKFLKDTGFPYIDRVDDMMNTFTGRAMINAWVLMYSSENKTNAKTRFKWVFERAEKAMSLTVDELYAKMVNIASSQGNIAMA